MIEDVKTAPLIVKSSFEDPWKHQLHQHWGQKTG